MPKSYLTEDEKIGMSENAIYLMESVAADEAGDAEAAWEWLQQAELPAHALLAAKRANGSHWIKKRGLKTEAAEKAYGKDWLDRAV
ncbi:MAG: hypothetical protein WCZ23_07100 [Rhodospirillaceae bacterium]